MQNIFTKTLFALCLIFVSISTVFASEKEDFVFQYENYREVFDVYNTAKQNYLKNKTLSSKNDAIAATKNLLVQRNQIFRTYFLALRFGINKTPGIDKEIIDEFSIKLNEEITYLESNLSKLEDLATPTLEELFSLSADFEAKKVKYKLLSYQALSYISLGKIQKLQNDIKEINSNLNPYIEKTSINYLPNWYNDSQKTNLQIDNKIMQIKVLIFDLGKNTSENSLDRGYAEIIDNLEDTKTNLIVSKKQHHEILLKLNQENNQN